MYNKLILDLLKHETVTFLKINFIIYFRRFNHCCRLPL